MELGIIVALASIVIGLAALIQKATSIRLQRKALSQARDLTQIKDAAERELLHANQLDSDLILTADRSKVESDYLLRERLAEAKSESRDSDFSDISLALGELHYRSGELDIAASYLDNAMLYYSDIGNNRKLARSLMLLAAVFTASGDHDSATEAANQVLAITEPDEEVLNAEAKLRLGICSRRSGDFTKALGQLESSIEIADRIGTPTLKGEALIAKGDVYWKAQDWSEAEKNYKQSAVILEVEIYSNPNNELARFHLSQAQYALGRVCIEHSRYSEADKLLSSSLASLEDIGNFFGIEICTQLLGRLAEKTDDFDSARRWYQESLLATIITGNDMRWVETLFFISHLAYAMSDMHRAKALALNGVNKASEFHFLEHHARLSALIGNISFDTSFVGEAIKSYEVAIKVAALAGGSTTEDVFSLLNGKLKEIIESSKKDVATYIIQNLNEWYLKLEIEGVEAIIYEKGLKARGKIEHDQKPISTYLMELVGLLA